MAKNKEKEIMTAKEVADYLSLHPLTVHRYAREGKIPAFKIGTDWRFSKKYIEKWIKQKLTSGSQDKEQQKNDFEWNPLGLKAGVPSPKQK